MVLPRVTVATIAKVETVATVETIVMRAAVGRFVAIGMRAVQAAAAQSARV